MRWKSILHPVLFILAEYGFVPVRGGPFFTYVMATLFPKSIKFDVVQRLHVMSHKLVRSHRANVLAPGERFVLLT